MSNNNKFIDWIAKEKISPGDLVTLNFCTGGNIIRYDMLHKLAWVQKTPYPWELDHKLYDPIFVYLDCYKSHFGKNENYSEQVAILLYDAKHYVTLSDNVFKYKPK